MDYIFSAKNVADYLSVPDSEKDNTTDDQQSYEAAPTKSSNSVECQRWSWHSMCFFCSNLALFLASGTLFFLSRQPIPRHYADHVHEQQRNHYLKLVSMPSPVLDDTEVRVFSKRMDATLVNTDPPAKLRHEPSDELDKAWESLYDMRPIAISREQVIAMGKDPESSVRIPASWGHGNDSYFGRVDVFHQMHCLDALRREARFEHYYGAKHPGGFNETSGKHQLHLSHCVWVLAQNIMCNANTDIYTHIWTDTLEHAFPDFNIDHKCRDYDAVLEWQRKNGLDEQAFVALRRPEGYPFRIMTHEFKKIHGWKFEEYDEGNLTSAEVA